MASLHTSSLQPNLQFIADEKSPPRSGESALFFQEVGKVVAKQLDLLSLQVEPEHWVNLRQLQSQVKALDASLLQAGDACARGPGFFSPIPKCPRVHEFPGIDSSELMSPPDCPSFSEFQVESHDVQDDNKKVSVIFVEPVSEGKDSTTEFTSHDEAGEEARMGSITCADRGLTVEERLQNLTNISALAGENCLQGQGSSIREAGLLPYIIHHPYFSTFITIVILINALVICIQTEWMANNVGTTEPLIFEVMNMACNIIFIVELGARLYVERCAFFQTGKGFRWKMFDVVIVSVAMLEILMDYAAGGINIPGGTILRVLRMLRILRTMRALHTAMVFRELRMMLYGMINSFMALTWLVILLLSVMLVFSVFITHMVTYARQEDYEVVLAGGDGRANIVFLDEHFGTISKSMYSLYKSFTSGENWGVYGNVFNKTSPILGACMMIYIGFVNFAIMNVVTGVFVDFATKAADADVDSVALENTREHRRMIDEFCKVFQSGDADGSGELGIEEFVTHVMDPRVQAYFKFIDLDFEAYGAQQIFVLLDFDGSGSIDLSEFVAGLSKFRGRAKSLDIALLHHDIRHLDKKLSSMWRETNAGQRRLTREMTSATGSPKSPTRKKSFD